MKIPQSVFQLKRGLLYINKELAFSIYPNPVTTSTTFSFNTTKAPVLLEIFNLQGDVVFRSEIADGSISVNWEPADLNARTYLAKLADGENGVRVKKVLVLK